MRLATFNLQHGHAPTVHRADGDRLAAAVAELDADVLALQEVDRGQRRSGGLDLTAIAAEAMGAQAWRYAPTLWGTPGARWVPASTGEEADPAQSSFGIALLSRYPVREWQQVSLPSLGSAVPVVLPRLPVPGPSLARMRPRAGIGLTVGDEPRTALIARLEAPDGPRTVVAAHLSFLPGWGRHQLAYLRDRLAGEPDPLVLMGDLNLVNTQPRRITGWIPLAVHPTFPRRTPVVQLDHLLARGSWGPVLDSRAVALPVSDHRALVVDLATGAP